MGLSLLLHLTGPQCTWFAHYCGDCGLRLVISDNAGHCYYVDDPQLVASRPGSLIRTAVSPFPVSSLTLKDLPQGGGNRYCLSRPCAKYSVEMSKSTGLPVKFQTRGVTKAYAVSYPRFSRLADYNIHNVMNLNRLPEIHESRGLEDGDRYIRLSSEIGRTVGAVKISKRSWGVSLYSHQTAMAAKTDTSISDETTTNKNSAGENYQLGEVYSSDGRMFSADWSCFPWKSSRGYLLWTCRLARDAISTTTTTIPPTGKVSSRLVLVDAFDRLVAMEIDGGARRRNEQLVRRVDPPPLLSSQRELRLYGKLANKLVEEILTSYMALKWQSRRRSNLDYVEKLARSG